MENQISPESAKSQQLSDPLLKNYDTTEDSQ